MQRILSVFMMLILLAGTTGITVLQHVCNSGKTREIKAMDGISLESASVCGCEEDEAGPPVGNDTDGVSLNASPCCISFTTFFRISFTTITTGPLFMVPLFDFQPVFNTNLTAKSLFDLIKPDQPFFRFHSPPLTGMKLLVSLHQIKIPASS